MSFALSFVLLFVNTLASLTIKNIKFLSFALVFFMWLLFWSNTKNPDYISYISTFNNLQNGYPIFNESSSEFGFRILMKIAITLGLNYETFLAIIGFSAFLLIHQTVKKFSDNYSYIYIAYFIFPFLLDVVQIRNFLAMSILIYSIQYIVEKTARANIKYILCILLATTIHYSAILYLPFLLINLDKKKNWIRCIVFVSMGLSIIVLLNGKEIPYIDQLIQILLNSDKVLNWFDSTTNWGFLLFWTMQIFSFLMMWITKEKFKSILKNNKSTSPVLVYAGRYIEVVYWINVLAFLYLPLYTLASTFTRLMRNLLLLNYIAFSIVYNNLHKRDEKVIFTLMVSVYILFFFFVDLFIPYRESVINAILKNNIFS